MTSLLEIQARIEREQAYFARRGALLEVLLQPPAARSTLDELSNQLGVPLPTPYAAFLAITNGIWANLSLPRADPSNHVPLVNSAGLYGSHIVLQASIAVRDLIECGGVVDSSPVIAIGQDGMIGDCIALCTQTMPARVVSCTSDRPGQLYDPDFQLATNFDEFMARFLGASEEGREYLTYWME